jgi:cbb3-type cytochrome oxidase maturation protein
MDILYLLIPLSAVLVLAILGVFAWALHGGQFDDLEQHGEQILDVDSESVDRHQGPPALPIEKSVRRH